MTERHFPGYDVLAKRDTPSWNEVTRKAIDRRLAVSRQPKFFSGEDFATLEAMCDRVLPQPPLTPTDPRVAARMDQLLNVNDCYLFREVATVVTFQRVVGPRLLGMTPDEAAIAEVMPRAHVVFDQLALSLGDQPFFTGETLSLADMLLACDIDFFSGIPEWEPLTGARPNLCAWLDRMNGRPSMQATTWAAVAEMARAA